MITNKKHKYGKKNFFTLVELLVAMAVFTVLMYCLMRFFNDAQKIFTNCARKTEMYENARIAMDLITRDLQSAYYQNGVIPFWHLPQNNNTSNEMLAFISATPIPPENIKSKLCEIKYQLHYTTSATDNLGGWLMRSATGDNEGNKWNFYNNFNVGSSGSNNAFTTGTDSSAAFEQVIPYVTKLEFTCYKEDGTKDTDDTAQYPLGDINTASGFPYSVKVDLSLMDKAAWKKWIAIGGRPDYPLHDLAAEQSAGADTFRKNNERKFTKTIYLGDRGQYD